MKYTKYIGHPVLLMCLYLLLLIESEHFGGFYILYVLMAATAAAPFAVISLAGLLCVFAGYKLNTGRIHLLKPVLYTIGVLLMYLGLIVFFERKERLATFELGLPTATFILFGLCSLFFLFNTASLYINPPLTRPMGVG